MIEVNVHSLLMGAPSASSVLVLKPVEEAADNRILPIFIGPAEAASIGSALNGHIPLRPMTHDLIGNIFDGLGVHLMRVDIIRSEKTLFFANLEIEQDGSPVFIDSRPSDAIALAVRNNTPIYVDESVMSVASFPSLENIKEEYSNEELLKFHQFIQDVKPDDFRKPNNTPQ